MKQIFFLCLLSFLVVATGHTQQKKTQVLLLGSFHFDNPGLDVAKFENANIMSPQRQKEVLEVVEKGYFLGEKVIRHAKVVVGN